MLKMCHKNCDVLAHDNALVRYISVPYFSEDKREPASHTPKLGLEILFRSNNLKEDISDINLFSEKKNPLFIFSDVSQ